MQRRITITALALTALLALPAGPLHAQIRTLRRPLDTVLNPAISAHYDNDTGSGAKNYRCGTDAVYNGHKGTDFRAAVGTAVSAASKGRLYSRLNACETYGYLGSTCGGGFGNHVRIDHEGNLSDGVGFVTIYAHLQKDTAIGVQDVNCGTFVGKSGSSGSSTGPHLHFETRKYTYGINDPFAGACSTLGSLWVDQGAGVPAARCQ